jgi:hypothetical protein
MVFTIVVAAAPQPRNNHSNQDWSPINPFLSQSIRSTGSKFVDRHHAPPCPYSDTPVALHGVEHIHHISHNLFLYKSGSRIPLDSCEPCAMWNISITSPTIFLYKSDSRVALVRVHSWSSPQNFHIVPSRSKRAWPVTDPDMDLYSGSHVAWLAHDPRSHSRLGRPTYLPLSELVHLSLNSRRR